ncbi:MAG: hypothetical protein E2O39_01445 [Planctomycetota bacterium]|nr:MAG: hypothetical protein E2O39_01445 [Planctomycetota bacterium]
MSPSAFVSSRSLALTLLVLALPGSALGQGALIARQGSRLPAGAQPGVAAHVVDFEGIPTGTILSTVFASDGAGPIEVRGTNPALGAVNAAVVFDSSNPTGGDFDLGSPNEDFGGPGIGDGGAAGSPFENALPLEKTLIVAENLIDSDGDGLVDDPDDSADSGTTRFDFAAIAPVTMLAMTIIDVEDGRDQPTVEFRDSSGLLIATVLLPFVGDNGVSVVDFGAIAGVFTVEVILNGSGSIDDLTFREQCKARIGDTVWHDVNGDGLRDPAEPGIEGVVLTLLGDMGQVLDTQVTDRRGQYLFIDLCSGDYKVVIDPESLPSGFFPSPCDVGNDDELDNDCSPVSVSLPTNATLDTSIDFGFQAPCTGSIGDFLWLDLDEDGLQDEDEPGLEGITVVLRDIVGNELATMTTLPGGFYNFMGLCTGTYIVEVDESTLPSNFVPTDCDVGGDDTIDNDCSPVVVVLDLDDTADSSVDFGYRSLNDGIIGNFVWIDLQCDGLQSGGGPEGLSGDDLGTGEVGVILSDDMGVILSLTTTLGDGTYRFNGLADGTYVIRIDADTLPEGLIEAPCDVGDDDTIDNDCSPETVVLDSGEGTPGNVNITIDFGYITIVCGEEGCGVGYWKQPQHHDSWPAPYTPDTLFSDVFEDAFPGDTLQDVLRKQNSGLDGLGRHTVASLLNAQSDDVPYPLPSSVVVSLFDGLFPATSREYIALKDFFEDLNETSCPLN